MPYTTGPDYQELWKRINPHIPINPMYKSPVLTEEAIATLTKLFDRTGIIITRPYVDTFKKTNGVIYCDLSVIEQDVFDSQQKFTVNDAENHLVPPLFRPNEDMVTTIKALLFIAFSAPVGLRSTTTLLQNNPNLKQTLSIGYNQLLFQNALDQLRIANDPASILAKITILKERSLNQKESTYLEDKEIYLEFLQEGSFLGLSFEEAEKRLYESREEAAKREQREDEIARHAAKEKPKKSATALDIKEEILAHFDHISTEINQLKQKLEEIVTLEKSRADTLVQPVVVQPTIRPVVHPAAPKKQDNSHVISAIKACAITMPLILEHHEDYFAQFIRRGTYYASLVQKLEGEIKKYQELSAERRSDPKLVEAISTTRTSLIIKEQEDEGRILWSHMGAVRQDLAKIVTIKGTQQYLDELYQQLKIAPERPIIKIHRADITDAALKRQKEIAHDIIDRIERSLRSAIECFSFSIDANLNKINQEQQEFIEKAQQILLREEELIEAEGILATPTGERHPNVQKAPVASQEEINKLAARARSVFEMQQERMVQKKVEQQKAPTPTPQIPPYLLPSRIPSHALQPAPQPNPKNIVQPTVPKATPNTVQLNPPTPKPPAPTYVLPKQDSNALQKIARAHRKIWDKESTSFGGFFRRTEVKGHWGLIDFILHAQKNNNRTRRAFVGLGWMMENGKVLDRAPEEVFAALDELKDLNTYSK